MKTFKDLKVGDKIYCLDWLNHLWIISAVISEIQPEEENDWISFETDWFDHKIPNSRIDRSEYGCIFACPEAILKAVENGHI